MSLRAAGARRLRFHCVADSYCLLTQICTEIASAVNLRVRRREPSQICPGFRLYPLSCGLYVNPRPPYMAWFLSPRIFPFDMNVRSLTLRPR